jgi:arginyl-tRNA synthetase
VKERLRKLLAEALAELARTGTLPRDYGVVPEITRPRHEGHGDFSSNAALALKDVAGLPSRELAQRIKNHLPRSELIDKVEIAGPGFINFFLSHGAQYSVVPAILEQAGAYGRSDIGQGRKVMVEFVSANPTGPLHVGHGRQAALGDAIAALLEAQEYAVTREFYYNDAGVQIDNLTLSVQARAKGLKPGDAGWPEAAYNGEYIQDIANDYLARNTVRASDAAAVVASGKVDDLEGIRKFAVTYLRNEQDIDLQKFGVKFDSYYLETSLYTDGKVDAVVAALIAGGKTYEKDGALWLRTTDYGDDKDRVMRKSDGTYTYFVPDVAYHVAKWQRGFTRVINVQGTDHHSTVTRVRAGLQALNIGIPTGYPDYVLHSLVKVMRGGQEVRISKRAGSYVTVRDLIEWVGRDATRFFLVSRRADAEFVFDIDLALAQTEENPVYYVQYAHARVCSVFKQLEEKGLMHDRANGNLHLKQLTEEHERSLFSRLSRFPEVVESAATDLEPHQIANYLRALAYDLHAYYNTHTFLVEATDLRDARLCLIEATRQVIANGLRLLNVSAPERM